MTNRRWAILYILWRAVSSPSDDQQHVSNIAYFVKGNLIASFPMTNFRMWVPLHLLWKSLITSFPMANSKWVTLHIFWMAVSSHHSLWPTGSELHCIFCERQSHHNLSYDQQEVSTSHVLWKPCHTSFPTINREWVVLHILWSAVSLHHFLWPTGSEYIASFMKAVSSHFSYDQQRVCNIAHFVKGSLITFFLWPTVCEWHYTLYESPSCHIFFNCSTASEWYCTFCEIFSMINRKWVTLHILWKAISFPMTSSLWVILHIIWKGVSSHLSYDQ